MGNLSRDNPLQYLTLPGQVDSRIRVQEISNTHDLKPSAITQGKDRRFLMALIHFCLSEIAFLHQELLTRFEHEQVRCHLEGSGFSSCAETESAISIEVSPQVVDKKVFRQMRPRNSKGFPLNDSEWLKITNHLPRTDAYSREVALFWVLRRSVAIFPDRVSRRQSRQKARQMLFILQLDTDIDSAKTPLLTRDIRISSQESKPIRLFLCINGGKKRMVARIPSMASRNVLTLDMPAFKKPMNRFIGYAEGFRQNWRSFTCLIASAYLRYLHVRKFSHMRMLPH